MEKTAKVTKVTFLSHPFVNKLFNVGAGFRAKSQSHKICRNIKLLLLLSNYDSMVLRYTPLKSCDFVTFDKTLTRQGFPRFDKCDIHCNL